MISSFKLQCGKEAGESCLKEKRERERNGRGEEEEEVKMEFREEKEEASFSLWGGFSHSFIQQVNMYWAPTAYPIPSQSGGSKVGLCAPLPLSGSQLLLISSSLSWIFFCDLSSPPPLSFRQCRCFSCFSFLLSPPSSAQKVGESEVEEGKGKLHL